MENLNDFLAISIVGAMLSMVIEYITNKAQTNPLGGKIIAIVLSTVVGGAYWFLSGTAIWQSILGVLAAASTVYAIVFSGAKSKDREDA